MRPKRESPFEAPFAAVLQQLSSPVRALPPDCAVVVPVQNGGLAGGIRQLDSVGDLSVTEAIPTEYLSNPSLARPAALHAHTITNVLEPLTSIIVGGLNAMTFSGSLDRSASIVVAELVETAAGEMTLADETVLVDFVAEQHEPRPIALFDEVAGPVIHILLAYPSMAVHAGEAFAQVVLVSALVPQRVDDRNDLLER